MNYTAAEVMQFVEEEDVKFIRLAICDIYGKQKNISIMPAELSRAFDSGIMIDGTSVAGFGQPVPMDLVLRPDPSTLAILPWRPEHGRVIRMFCDITKPDGTAFECDTRRILKYAVDAAAAKGLSFDFGSETEFYLFKLDENGEPTGVPYDQAGYMDIAPLDKGENVRREVCLTLESMGICPESSHHEAGPGQNEIEFRHSDALHAADNAITFFNVVNVVAARNGLKVDFGPKPIKSRPGSGMHVKFSVTDTRSGRDVMPLAIAGILDRICDMTLFLNPSDESYMRLGTYKAPGYVTWSGTDRSQLVRFPGERSDFKYAQLRSPDPSANPYLAYAILIYAAMYGIDNSLELPAKTDINLSTADPETLQSYKRLPAGKSEAIRTCLDSEFIRSCLPQEVIMAYCK
ncbi:MAG: glutamine synthetase family protein [Lachnospiraceae bacterium]|nr:glutamine synthetase family protein [Lachnospiraceae bacterium]